jgi:uncharacterized protein (DUF934 family)
MSHTLHILPPSAPLPADALWLPNTEALQEPPSELRGAIERAGTLVLQFPKWTDGRAYSQAVLLRRRLGHRGAIVAAGDVVADMAPLLRRCGFSAMALRADQDPQVAERALLGFDGHYQADPGAVVPAQRH